jgi:hypothetical protein
LNFDIETDARAYSDYYLRSRTHLALGKDAPESRPIQSPRGLAISSGIPFLMMAGLWDKRGKWVSLQSGGLTLDPFGASSPEGMDGSRTGEDLTAVPSPLWDEILLSGADWNALAIDNQRIAALCNDKVFVKIMHMWG